MDSFVNCLPNGKSLKSTMMSALYSFQGPSMMRSQLVMRQWFLTCVSQLVSRSAWLAVVLNVQTAVLLSVSGSLIVVRLMIPVGVRQVVKTH